MGYIIRLVGLDLSFQISGGISARKMNDKNNLPSKRQYPPLYEKLIPIAIAIISIAIVVLLFIVIFVILGKFQF